MAFLAGALLSSQIAKHLVGLRLEANHNLWFEADVPRVVENLTDGSSDHYRTSVHPLTSLFLSTPTIALVKLGIPPITAAHAFAAVGAGLLSGLFFLLLCRLHRSLLMAAIFSALLLLSAAFMFFSSIVELYVWGALSIVGALMLATVEGRFQAASLVVAGIASLSITITNWMVGLAANVTRERMPRALLYGALTLATVASLSFAQRAIYPTTGRFFDVFKERQYANFDVANRLRSVPRVFFLGSVVQYRVGEEPRHVRAHVTSQHGHIRPGALGHAATALWALILCGGVYGAFLQVQSSDQVRRTLARMTLMLVPGQFALHVVYGGETFLYALHFAPLLILLASFIAFLSRRSLALWGTGALIVLAGWHNWQQLSHARTMAETILQQTEVERPFSVAVWNDAIMASRRDGRSRSL